jgi:hypothetical protein
MTDEEFVAGLVESLWEGVRPANASQAEQPHNEPPSAGRRQKRKK